MSTPCFPFASLRSTVLCSSFATLCLSSLFYSLLCLAFASLRTAYLCCAFAVLCSVMPFLSMLCLCKSGQCHAFPCLCSAGQRTAVPSHVCSKLSLFHAQHFTAELFLRCSLQREAAQCVASPFRCFSLLGCALPFALPDIAFPLPCHASPLLLHAVHFPCCSKLCNAFAGQCTALLSRCMSKHFFARPCFAFALLCRSQLCPCAAVQETSAQRKRPLPELRHWPRPR